MRKFLMSLTVIAGATIAASAANAAPVAIEFVAGTPHVQTVQFYEGWHGDSWRAHEWRRHEEWVRARRHEEWRHRREYRGW